MTKRIFSAYAIAAPLLLAPASLWLWWQECDGHPAVVAVAWGLPVLWAYVVPGIGTNVLKVWEFDTRLRVGRFRPQHGFVFGSATSLLAWLVHGAPAGSVSEVLRLAFVLASVLGFWNLLYDVAALRCGLLRVYNQPWADGRGEAEIALDYAPWFFAGFGAVQGIALGLVEMAAPVLDGWPQAVAVLVVALPAACAVPTAGFILQSRRRHGHSGTRPVSKVRA